MKRQVQRFENSRTTDLVIDIEMNPDRYVLDPGDVLQITFDLGDDGSGLHTIVHENGLQIYLWNFDTAEVLINDKPAKPWARKSAGL
jgi:protein involved in polysaccharide export with SLBB domain